ncbi:MAG: hypothetical protein HXS54_14595 [Theionarchaea archaeon]|nr:hypothetical protein [Theionarchaea archaeon]
MKDNKSPLDELFIERQEVDENILRNILIRFVKIERESTSIIPTSDYDKLKEKEKILVYLLSRKAMKICNLIENESGSPSEISKVSGVKIGTVLPAVRSYYKKGMLSRNKNGYFIPNHALEKVAEVLEP